MGLWGEFKANENMMHEYKRRMRVLVVRPILYSSLSVIVVSLTEGPDKKTIPSRKKQHLILWMDEILHHLRNPGMIRQHALWFQRWLHFAFCEVCGCRQNPSPEGTNLAHESRRKQNNVFSPNYGKARGFAKPRVGGGIGNEACKTKDIEDQEATAFGTVQRGYWTWEKAGKLGGCWFKTKIINNIKQHQESHQHEPTTT